MRKIRVLVVDDSILFREVLSRGISSDLDIEVVAKASDPFDARDKILEFHPDVVTCDVQMPKMNGIEFVRRLMPQYPIPVVVVSTLSETIFDAMDAGAVDFVIKPDVQSVRSVEDFINELISKVKVAAMAKIPNVKAQTGIENSNKFRKYDISKKIIAIGASTGGTEVIYNILKEFPARMPGIVITQHIPAIFSKMFAERLEKTTLLNVKEAENGDIIECGKVLIAPGDKQMRVRRTGDNYKVECFDGEKVNGHSPSVDVLFNSVAKEVGKNAIGVILTGMGQDGAKGLLAMRESGATTIGQDEATSIVYGMPRVAYEIGAVQRQAPLEDIPNLIQSLL